MEKTKGECLGGSCRFYYEKPDTICFKQGVLPRCSPRLKAKRKKLDEAAPDLYEALKEIKQFVLDNQFIQSAEQQIIVGKCFLALAKAELIT